MSRRPDSEADIGWAAWGCAIFVIALILAPVVCSCAYTGPPFEFSGFTVGVAHYEGELEESGAPNNFLSDTYSNAAYLEAHFIVVDPVAREREQARWERQGQIYAQLAADRRAEDGHRHEDDDDEGGDEGGVEEALQMTRDFSKELVFLVALAIPLIIMFILYRIYGRRAKPEE